MNKLSRGTVKYELQNKEFLGKDFHIFSFQKVFGKQDNLKKTVLNHVQNYIQK